MVTLDDPSVSQVLFHPRREPPDFSPTGIPTLTACAGAKVSGYLHCRPDSPTGILFFHGNGEIAADYDALSAFYTACGASFWVVDYRGYGRSTGSPSFSTLFEDAECMAADVPRIIRICREDDASIILMGRSLGSAAAIYLAAVQPDVFAGLILDSPYASAPDLVRRLGGPRIDRQARESLRDNLDLIESCTLPTLIMHGTHDRIIPVQEAEALRRACGSRVKRLVKIDGAGHNTLLQVGLDRYRAEISRHIARSTDAGRSG